MSRLTICVATILLGVAMSAATLIEASAGPKGGGGGGGGGGGARGGGGGGAPAFRGGGGGGAPAFRSAGPKISGGAIRSGGPALRGGRVASPRLANPRGVSRSAGVTRQGRIDRAQRRAQQQQLQQKLQAQRTQQRLQREQARQQQKQQQQLSKTQQQQQLSKAASTGVTQQAAQKGRFAAGTSPTALRTASLQRTAGLAPQYAWRRGWPAAFVPWFGGVFWPFAYWDIFYYPFWPYAYDPFYFAYLYDDFFDGIFWGYGPYPAYAYGPPLPAYAYGPEADIYGYGYSGPGRRGGPRPPANERAMREVCSDAGTGVTAWPFGEIEQTVRPTAEQQALFDELKTAAAGAAEAFKASCADSFPMTPPGRLQAMANRLDATLQAVRAVRPALGKFYEALSDEQRARFNALGPRLGDRDRRRTARAQEPAADTCGEPKPGLTTLPIERIETVVRPTDAQRAAFDKLAEATRQAVATLQAACPDVIPLTPIGRLEVMERRLDAMSKAAQSVQPTLEEFYSSLSNEQKARFNSMRATASR